MPPTDPTDDSTNASYRVVPLKYFSRLFGGYCSNSAATNEAKTKGIPTAGRNPWAKGGCQPKKAGSIGRESRTLYSVRVAP